jgi:hypothetical protein
VEVRAVKTTISARSAAQIPIRRGECDAMISACAVEAAGFPPIAHLNRADLSYKRYPTYSTE